jgi:two-component system cell cycle response regulator
MSDANNEKRAAPRNRTVRNGKIVFANFTMILDCTMRDISHPGAKVIAVQPAAVPDQFRLILITDQVMRDAKVVWRKGREIGVEFEGPAVDLTKTSNIKLQQFQMP